jgi:hypothetical protein
MTFWTDGKENSTRVRNAKLTWAYLKDMVNYLQKTNIPCSAKIFDYSPEKIIEDAVHIPYPLGVYKRAEKLNAIIELYPNDDYISLIDCDVFIHKTQWYNLLELISNIQPNTAYFFNWAKISHTIKFSSLDDISFDDEYNLAFTQGYAGGFGAFSIAPIGPIKEIGKYDTKFTTWGGEDGNLVDRYTRGNKYLYKNIAEGFILPIHLPHDEDRENILYFNRDEYLRNNF